MIVEAECREFDACAARRDGVQDARRAPFRSSRREESSPAAISKPTTRSRK